jgi:hypothetical protein
MSGDTQTSPPVKVANSHGSNRVFMENPLYIKDSEGIKFIPLDLKRAVVDRFRQQFVNIHYLSLILISY